MMVVILERANNNVRNVENADFQHFNFLPFPTFSKAIQNSRLCGFRTNFANVLFLSKSTPIFFTLDCDTYIELAGNKQRCSPYQLQGFLCDTCFCDVQVNQLHGQVQSLVVEFKVLLHLHEPVHQDGSHASSQVLLFAHVWFNLKHKLKEIVHLHYLPFTSQCRLSKPLRKRLF